MQDNHPKAGAFPKAMEVVYYYSLPITHYPIIARRLPFKLGWHYDIWLQDLRAGEFIVQCASFVVEKWQ
jgi:hypothetical protein